MLAQVIDFTKYKKENVANPYNVVVFPKVILADNSEDIGDEGHEVVEEHYAHPIKEKSDIMRISSYLLENNRYRDNAIFIIGINVGLRCSDLRMLRVCDFVNQDGTFKDKFYLVERKTSNTRNTKQNRHIAINDAVKQSISLLLAHEPKALDDYLFTPKSNNMAKEQKLPPLSRKSFFVIIKEVTSKLNIDGRYATHTLRKTFGYHLMKDNSNDPRMLSLLQQIFGHSTQQMTLRYIGFTEEEVSKAYNELNLGIR